MSTEAAMSRSAGVDPGRAKEIDESSEGTDVFMLTASQCDKNEVKTTTETAPFTLPYTVWGHPSLCGQ